MKRTYWKTSGDYWEWERTGEIYVYGLLGLGDNEIERVVGIVNDVIKEFKLPLKVKNGNKCKKEDLIQVEKLFQLCVRNHSDIDFPLLEKELETLRIKKRELPYGLIILVDDTLHKFRNLPGTSQPAIFGCSTPDGLIVIRKKHIDDATKHEFAHMIGLGVHHDNCVMSYEYTTYEQFCDECIEEIMSVWKE